MGGLSNPHKYDKSLNGHVYTWNEKEAMVYYKMMEKLKRRGAVGCTDLGQLIVWLLWVEQLDESLSNFTVISDNG